MENKKKFIHIIAIIWSIGTLIPLIFTIISSFKNTTEIYESPFELPKHIRMNNYTEALFNGNMLRAIGNSFFLAITTVVLVIVIGSMAGYVISRNKGKVYNLIYMYFVCGILIPIHSTFIPLVKIVGSINGTNNYIVMILIYTTFNLPFAVFLISGYMKGISKSLEEAAIIDGCGTFRIFTKVIFPLSKPSIATVAILTFLAVYNDLIFAVLFITKKDLATISLGLSSFYGEHSVELGPIFAAIVVALLPMLIIYLFFQEKIISGISAGAVKG